MPSIILILVNILHASPFGMEVSDHDNFSIFVMSWMLIAFLLAVGMCIRGINKWEKGFAFITSVVILYFMCNYALVDANERHAGTQLFNWASDDRKER